MLVYNLESYGYFYMGICRSLCHSSSFKNVIFAVEVYIFFIKFYRKIYFIEGLLNNFISFYFIFTYVLLDE